MARRTAVWSVLMAAPWSSPVLLDSCDPLGRGCVSRLAKRPRAAWPWHGGLGRDNRAGRRTAPPAWRIGSSVELVSPGQGRARHTHHPGPDGRLLRGRRGPLVSDPAAPFGGVMQPGLGREGAHEGLLGGHQM